MKFIVLMSLMLSTSVFSCEMPKYKIQNDVIQKLISKFSADKDNPIESIRKVDFTGVSRVRFVYLSKGLAAKNEVLNFKVSEQCGVSFEKLEF